MLNGLKTIIVKYKKYYLPLTKVFNSRVAEPWPTADDIITLILVTFPRCTIIGILFAKYPVALT